MKHILDIVRPWLELVPGNGEVEQLWFAVLVLGAIVGLFLLLSVLKLISYFLTMPRRHRAKKAIALQNAAVQNLLSQQKATISSEPQAELSSSVIRFVSDETSNDTDTVGKPRIAKVQIFIDHANFDKNWSDNAYGLLAEGTQKVRLDWNKVTDIVMREVQQAITGWQPQLEYAGTYVQASVLPERFTTPRDYKLPKALAAQYYIYAKDADLVTSKIDGKEYIAKKLHPTHKFLKHMMRKLPGYNVTISRRVIARNPDGTPVVMKSRSGVEYVKSGEKAVDSRVIADMTSGAMNNGYDIAVLLGSDTDFLPVIDLIQRGYNKPVIHFGFERGGHQVRAACWSHIVLTKELVAELREAPKQIIQRDVAQPAQTGASLGGQDNSLSVPEAASVPLVPDEVIGKTAVSTVAAQLASPAKNESVKQVVQLFTPEANQHVPDNKAVTTDKSTDEAAVPTAVPAPVSNPSKTVFTTPVSVKAEGQ